MTVSMPRPVEVTVRPLRNETDLQWALAELDTVIDAAFDTPEDARREVLSELIYAYEQRHHPIPPPDPIDAIEFRLNQQGPPERHWSRSLGAGARQPRF